MLVTKTSSVGVLPLTTFNNYNYKLRQVQGVGYGSANLRWLTMPAFTKVHLWGHGMDGRTNGRTDVRTMQLNANSKILLWFAPIIWHKLEVD